MLDIKNMTVQVEDKTIIDDFSFTLPAGKVCAFMGKNGAGKTSIASVIAGMPGYEVSQGSLHFLGEDLTHVRPENRARKGIFLSFQHPMELPGVSTREFLRTAFNEQQKFRGNQPMDAFDFEILLQEKAKELDVPQTLLDRSLNVGASGGEKKRMEILQMSLLEPQLVILDEIDSGLDVDALKHIATGILQQKTPAQSLIIITHYPRILEYIVPDEVHILEKGKIVQSGDMTLAREIEKNGYPTFLQEQDE